MMGLNGTSFERCLTPPDAVGRLVLCVFSDDSEDAFGCCAYARWQLSSGEYDVRIIAAKSRDLAQKWVNILQKDKNIVSTRNCGKFQRFPITLRLIQYFYIERVHGNFHVPCIIETIQKFLSKRVHRNFHVPCNIETSANILYRKVPWNFPCTL